MASSAIASQGTIVRVSTAEDAAKTITGITAASPPVVTATAHGYSNGDIIRITGVVGMTEVNDRAFVVANKTTNTFELKGVDGTSYTAYASGGSAYKQTMAEVANVRSTSLFEGSAPEIDVSNLRSLAREYRVGLADRGTSSLTIDIDTSDSGQARLRKRIGNATPIAFSVALSNSTACAFLALVQSFPSSIGVDAVVQGTVQLRVTNLESWFA